MSHPVWVRGLTPFGQQENYKSFLVAPRVGAWIETDGKYYFHDGVRSHPVWVRGLKH